MSTSWTWKAASTVRRKPGTQWSSKLGLPQESPVAQFELGFTGRKEGGPYMRGSSSTPGTSITAMFDDQNNETFSPKMERHLYFLSFKWILQDAHLSWRSAASSRTQAPSAARKWSDSCQTRSTDVSVCSNCQPYIDLIWNVNTIPKGLFSTSMDKLADWKPDHFDALADMVAFVVASTSLLPCHQLHSITFTSLVPKTSSHEVTLS